MIIFMVMIYLPKFLLPMYYVSNVLSINPPITSPQVDHNSEIIVNFEPKLNELKNILVNSDTCK
jgi:hypothetical protein